MSETEEIRVTDKSAPLKFCPACSTLYSYATDEDTKTLILTCNNCGYYENAPDTVKVRISRIRKDALNREIDPVIKYDQTLTSTMWVPCPNTECPSARDITKRNVGMCTDTMHKLVYFCRVCECMWQLQKGET